MGEAGAHVIMAARGVDRLEGALAEMHAAGHSAEALALDVSDIRAMGEKLELLGPIDVLVNSAGLARHSAALDTDVSDYDVVMDANVKGAYFLAVAVAKGLVAAGRPGSIITISSQMAHVGGIDRSVYCASKHAVEGFTKSMAIEWGKASIRINSICPTFIRTPLTQATFEDPERRAWIREKIKLPRVGEVEDIMGACVFLASDASAMVTGTSMLIDGGWTTG